VSPHIRLLPDALISQIAAGEVVERPASVVKELLENALDAGASELMVELEGGGRRLVRVADDGHGMGRDDALLAFDRHATSKIAAFDDLLRVGTLGFRGEALAAIAAVARVELLTADGSGEGWRVRLEGGRVLGAEPAGRARGTTVAVSSLFFNVPARRKFLKAPATELRRAVEVVQGYCLACPAARFTLRHEGRVLLAAPPAGEGSEGQRERIRQLFGEGLSGSLVELPPAARRGESIRGFVGEPGTARGRRIFLFVNGRLLRDRALLAAFYGAVREEWKIEDAPALFLFLDLPPEELDVNVHPQKAEVRFRDPGFPERVREALRRGLRAARGEAPAPLRALGALPPPPAWEGMGGFAAAHGSTVAEAPGGWPAAALEAPTAATVPLALPPQWAGGRAGLDSRLAEPHYTPPQPVPLSGGGRRSLRLLGQYKGALLLLEAPEALLLLDQHAAHERILYERLAASLAAERPATQRLLAPRLLALGPAEGLRLAELVPALAEVGFLLEPLSGHDFALHGVPAALDEDEAERMLLALAGEAAADAGRAPTPQALRTRLLDGLAAGGACRAAIKIHRPLALAEMQRLVSDLLACADPFSCPHGRPTLLEMRDAELERRFARR
jgi:DNA mismatch repair protein MutL